MALLLQDIFHLMGIFISGHSLPIRVMNYTELMARRVAQSSLKTSAFKAMAFLLTRQQLMPLMGLIRLDPFFILLPLMIKMEQNFGKVTEQLPVQF